MVSMPVESTYKPPVWTSLSLAQYAEIMGINPIQFMSGASNVLFPSTGCTDRWRQYPWQDPDKASREELAREIHQAEKDIAAELGYWPGLLWTEGERIAYPKYYKPSWTRAAGTTVTGRVKSIVPRFGKFIAQGVRSAELIGNANVVLSDEDGDGYKETATITQATSYTDPYEHRIFLAGESGKAEFEIRPVTTKVISGGTLTITLPVWLLFEPTKLAAFPGSDGFQNLDPFDAANIVDTVDVYRITADPSQGTQFTWSETGTLVDDIGPTTQMAALEPQISHRIVDAVTVTPATYDAGTGLFTQTQFSVGREPDYVELAYLSGDFVADSRSGEYKLQTDLARAIAWMATARLPRALCTQCETLQATEKRLRFDLAVSVDGSTSNVRFVSPDVLRCPFGTRQGEVYAWSVVRTRFKEGDVAPSVAVF